MAETNNEQEPQSENEGDGGETVDEKETTETDDSSEKNWEEIAKDQRKRAEKAENKMEQLQSALSDDDESEEESQAEGTSDDSTFSQFTKFQRKTRNYTDKHFEALEEMADELDKNPEDVIGTTAWDARKEQVDEEVEVEQTTPRPSESSSGVASDTEFSSDMSDEEHEQKVKELMGN